MPGGEGGLGAPPGARVDRPGGRTLWYAPGLNGEPDRPPRWIP